MDRATVLRAGAVVVAAVSFVGSGSFVLAHPKNDAAPLQPPAATQLALRTPTPSATPSAAPTRRPVGTPPPRITLAPGVQATQLPGITYTHVS